MASVRSTVTALLAVTVAAGCGGDEKATPDRPAAAQPVGDITGGSVAGLADCGDWKQGTEEERYATIEVLRGQLTPQRSKDAASPLPDERAYEVFQNACEPEFAESLRLYKLYAKVQGFAPLRP